MWVGLTFTALAGTRDEPNQLLYGLILLYHTGVS